MIQHIVLFKWKPGTTDAQIDDVFAQAGELVGIDGVERITLGRSLGEANHGFTHAFVINLTGDPALSTYLNHPVRKRYVTEVIAAIEEERIEIDVPEDSAHRHTRTAGRVWEWGATRHSASADAAALRLEEQSDEL